MVFEVSGERRAAADATAGREGRRGGAQPQEEVAVAFMCAIVYPSVPTKNSKAVEAPAVVRREWNECVLRRTARAVKRVVTLQEFEAAA